MKLKNFALLASVFALSGSMVGDIPDPIFNNKKPKDDNKFKPTPEEIELMKEMTPKDKKKFLKGRK